MADNLNGIVLLTGVPRSGTTLCCSTLNQHTNTIALHEPLPPKDLPEGTGKSAAVTAISSFARSTREQILESRVAPSKLLGGVVPTNPVSEHAEAGLRKEHVSLGRLEITKDLDQEFRLVIKHNALFTALLPELLKVLPVFAIVRNPLAVLCSWQTVDLPVQRGRIPMGERFDAKLLDELERMENTLNRQIRLLIWFFRKFSEALPDKCVLRYEEVVATSGQCLSVISEDTETQMPLSQKLQYPQLPMLSVQQMHDALMENADAFLPWYSPQDIERYTERLLHAQA